jgi:hypothetical protein
MQHCHGRQLSHMPSVLVVPNTPPLLRPPCCRCTLLAQLTQGAQARHLVSGTEAGPAYTIQAQKLGQEVRPRVYPYHATRNAAWLQAQPVHIHSPSIHRLRLQQQALQPCSSTVTICCCCCCCKYTNLLLLQACYHTAGVTQLLSET